MSQGQENDANFLEDDSSNNNNEQDSPRKGDDFIVPEISQSDDRKENLTPRGGKYHLRHIPNPNYSEDFRNKDKIVPL